MNRLFMFGMLPLSALLLGACDERAERPFPAPEVVRTTPASASPPAGDTSVPSADSALSARPEVAASGASPTRSNSSMTKAEESATMPRGGQANDHSAPLPPAGRASAP